MFYNSQTNISELLPFKFPFKLMCTYLYKCIHIGEYISLLHKYLIVCMSLGIPYTTATEHNSHLMVLFYFCIILFYTCHTNKHACDWLWLTFFCTLEPIPTEEQSSVVQWGRQPGDSSCLEEQDLSLGERN